MPEKIVKVIDRVPGNVVPLPTVDAVSLTEQKFRSHFLDKHVPVLIKGSASGWAALARWEQAGYLESLCSDEDVLVADTFNAIPPEPYYPFAVKKMQLAAALDEMRRVADNSTRMIAGAKLPASWAADVGGYSYLFQDLDKPPRAYQRDRLFSYKNASTEWHYHPIDETITTQLVGTKRISLFKLTSENWMAYSQIIGSNLHHIPYGERFFPKDMPLTKYEGVIEAGDAIYIPPFWWHGVDAADSAMGITLAHCFRSPIKRVADLKDPAIRSILKMAVTKRKRDLPGILFMIARSTLTRRIAGEKW